MNTTARKQPHREGHIMEFDSGYGYADYGYASIEANSYADTAWQSGDYDSYNYWSAESNSAWNTGVDMYVGGADATGTSTYSTGESYYDGGY
ncbi:hypothetical protein BH683_010355 [Williamsia sp. 1138]|uniref:hypothetical protein n=1 Tax=Williamsia sp. 1138 TaxID=1903117 RepID=UPI000A10C2BA|nr:hypothetical protein [Williamsia sp. 1138]OZG29301.1 hypothetical protein BH683_010355 [Williamsia sp. 1138]